MKSALAMLVLLAVAAPSAQAELSLVSDRKVGTLDHVTVKLEVSGKRKEFNNAEPRKTAAKDAPPAPATRELVISAVCNLEYDEKTLALPAADAGPRRSARLYSKAEAELKIGGDTLTPKLRSDRQLIVCNVDLPKTVVFAPNGPLTFSELEILDLLGNSLLLDELLPGEPVKDGLTWKLPDNLVAALLGLDAVSSNAVECRVKEITESVVRFELAGKVVGQKNDVEAHLELQGKYRFDLRLKRIDWLGLLVNEQRDISVVEAGWDVVLRLNVRVLPPPQSPSGLSDEALRDVPLDPTPERMLLFYQPADRDWSLQYDRRWYITDYRREDLILQMVDKGDYIARCIFSPLPQRPRDQLPSLADFQQDIRKALDKNFREFVSADQSVNAAKYRVFHVVARGEFNDAPAEWHYYHVADNDGRQMAVVFSIVDKKYLERLGNEEVKLVNDLRFTAPKDAAEKPADAKPPKDDDAP